MKNITKEQIDQLILDATSHITPNLIEQYTAELNHMTEECGNESINNSFQREIIAISVAQANVINIFREVIYALFLDE